MSVDAHGFFQGKRLVVFGAGYVGLEVVRRAIGHGLRVKALTRNPEKAAALLSLGAEPVVGELSGEVWHRQIDPGPEFVLNCVSSGGGGVEGYRRSYEQGMRSILAWAGRGASAIGTFVYTSSTSVYPQDGGVQVDETASVAGARETAQILIETENLLRASDSVKRWFVLRLAGIYGPKRHHLLDQLCAGDGEVSGTGGHRLNLIHRDDIVSAIFAGFGASPEIRNEVFNVADDRPASKEEVVGWLASRLELPAPRFTGEPAAGRRQITPDRAILNGKIKRVLGWKPVFPSYREGYEAILGA
jgi:nucleoside-diphosphate-sugar epimerase